MNSMCKGYANTVRKGPLYIHDTFSPSRTETYINDYCIYEFVLSSFNIRRGEDEYYALKNVAIDSTKRSQILCLI